jgi:hypothetical protein
MRDYIIMGVAGMAAFLIVRKFMEKKTLGLETTSLIDNKGREIYLQNKNGVMVDQYGGVWA